MGLVKKFASVALGLAVSATVASAQVTVNYTTLGNFTGGCSGSSCTVGGMTLTYTALTNNVIVLDNNNGFFSFLSYGFFTVTGGASTQQSFAGVGFDMTVTQNMPLAGGPQVITGPLLGGIDGTSSSLRWNAAPISWSRPAGTGTVDYTLNTIAMLGVPGVQMQAPTSNAGVTTVQGSVSTRPPTVIPEPSTYALMAAGLAGMFGFARRRRRSA